MFFFCLICLDDDDDVCVHCDSIYQVKLRVAILSYTVRVDFD